MATRLQADEPDKQSKWADIDDDEDDWAPDTVEWMDGTKSSLQPAEKSKSPPNVRQASPPKHDADIASDPRPSNDQRPSPTPAPGKTILKPGAKLTASQTSQTRPGLNLKKAPEVPSTPSKVSLQGTTKSPWAQLPPVDRVSPITFVPPAQPQQAPAASATSETPVEERDLASPSPAKEIGPDDFHRSLQEHSRGSRELFDSKSGRYEPVRGPRRSSVRQEGGFRPSSVLQRPSQSGQDGPTDGIPPHGWRTGIGSQDARSWGRRDSSAIADEPTGTPYQTPKHQQSVSGGQVASPTSARSEYFTPRQDPNSASYEQGMSSHVKEALRRKREKQEEEAREEEAKRKRIEAKLATLPPVPPKAVEANRSSDSHKSVEDENAPKSRKDTEDSKMAEARLSRDLQEAAESAKSQGAAVAPSAQTNHVMFDRETPRQMMGVAQAEALINHALKTSSGNRADNNVGHDGKGRLGDGPNVGKDAAKPTLVKRSSSPSRPPLGGQSVVDRRSPASPAHRIVQPIEGGRQLSQPPPADSSSPTSNSSRPFPSEHLHISSTNRTPSFERQKRNWNNLPANVQPSTGWSSASTPSQTTSAANVWGPPQSAHKTLGNGSFGSEVPGLPSIHFPPNQASDRAHHTPGPIGPPSSSPSISAQLSGQRPSPTPKLEQSQLNMTATAAPTASQPQAHNTGPFGHVILPSVYKPGSIKVDYAAAKKAWNNASSTIAQSDHETAAQKKQANLERPAPQWNFKQTFTQTTVDGNLRRQKVAPTATAPEPKNEGLPESFGGPEPNSQVNVGKANAVPSHALAQIARPSRFFGNGVEKSSATSALRSPQQNPTTELPSTQEPDAEHGLFEASTSPLVRLPSLTQAKVKLPPTPSKDSTSQDQPVVMPVRHKPYPRGPQPLADQNEWQDRYNAQFLRSPDRQERYKGLFTGQSQNEWQNQNRFAELLGRPAIRSPDPKPLPRGVDSSSRAPMDDIPPRFAATVSLPGKPDGFPVDTYNLPANMPSTKPADDKLFDEPTHGSKPQVSLSLVAPDATPILIRRDKAVKMAVSRGHSDERKPEFASNRTEFEFEAGAEVVIHVVGKPAKTKRLPPKAARAVRPYYNDSRRLDSRKPRPFKRPEEGNVTTVADRPRSTRVDGNANSASADTTTQKPRDSKWAKPAKGPPRKGRTLPNGPTMSQDPGKGAQNDNGRPGPAPKPAPKPAQSTPAKTTVPPTPAARKNTGPNPAKPLSSESSPFTKGRFEALGDAQMA